jgi:hypothetical protein
MGQACKLFYIHLEQPRGHSYWTFGYPQSSLTSRKRAHGSTKPREKRGKRKEFLCAFMFPVTKIPSRWEIEEPLLDRLLERVDEFQAEETHVTSHVLPQYPSKDWGSLAGNKAIRGRGGSRNGQVNGLIAPENMLGSDAGPESADIKGFSKLYEFGARGIRTANEHWNLQANAGRASCGVNLQALFLLNHPGRH